MKDIPGYIPPSHPSAKAQKPMKNQKYQIKISSIPQGMICTMDILYVLMQLKYEYHNLISIEDIAKDPYVSMIVVKKGPIEHILKEWVSGMARAKLLRLINMSHFERLKKSNACVKQLLVCFHGGYFWLNEPFEVTVGLIS